jgi:hypothetical protein
MPHLRKKYTHAVYSRAIDCDRVPGTFAHFSASCGDSDHAGRIEKRSWGIAVLLAALSSIVVAFAAVSLWLWQARRLRWRSWLASAALVAWVVGVGIKVHLDRAASARDEAAAVAGIAWPGDAPPPGSPATGAAPPPASGASSPVQAAPVPSLVAGLEQRLKEHPDDAAGWALLAQSYAFMGDAAAADAALRKAAALGMDEAELRARVEGATRSPAR